MTYMVRWLNSSQANIVWKVMAAVALMLSLVIGLRQYQMTVCQAAYNEASNASTRARAAAGEADREAIDNVMKAVAQEPRRAIEAVRAYNEARAAADEQRRRSPVPPPPSQTCG